MLMIRPQHLFFVFSMCWEWKQKKNQIKLKKADSRLEFSFLDPKTSSKNSVWNPKAFHFKNQIFAETNFIITKASKTISMNDLFTSTVVLENWKCISSTMKMWNLWDSKICKLNQLITLSQTLKSVRMSFANANDVTHSIVANFQFAWNKFQLNCTHSFHILKRDIIDFLSVEGKPNEKDKHYVNPIFILCLAPAEALLFSPFALVYLYLDDENLQLMKLLLLAAPTFCLVSTHVFEAKVIHKNTHDAF